MPADVFDLVAIVLLLAAAGGFLALLLRRRENSGCSCSCSKLACPTDSAARDNRLGNILPAEKQAAQPSSDQKETHDL